MSSKRFLIVLNLFLAFACTKKDQSQILRVAYTEPFASLDPQKLESRSSLRRLSLIYESLLSYAPAELPFRVVPRLAADLPIFSKDGSRLSIRLREGVKFSAHASFPEGKAREMTIHDFVYTLLRLADPFVDSPNYWLIDGKIEGLSEWRARQRKAGKTNYDDLPSGIQIQNRYDVDLSLRIRDRQFQHALAHPALSIVPREVVDKLQNDFAKQPVGSGPYVLSKWEKNDFLDFEKNPDYWGDASSGAFDKISFLFYDSDHKALEAFESNAVDIAKVPTEKLQSYLEVSSRSLKASFQEKGWRLSSAGVLDVFYLLFNLNDPQISKAGVGFRKALSLSLNRQGYSNTLNGGAATLATGVLPPGVFGQSETVHNPYALYNLKQAQQELKKAKWEGPLTLTLAKESQQLGEQLVEDLKALGLAVEANFMDSSKWIQALQKKNFQVSYLSWEADYPDAENFYQLLYGPNKAPSPNFSNMQDKAFDKEFEAMRALSDNAAKKTSVAKLHEIFLKQLPWAPILHKQEYYLNSQKVVGFNPQQFGDGVFRNVMKSTP